MKKWSNKSLLNFVWIEKVIEIQGKDNSDELVLI